MKPANNQKNPKGFNTIGRLFQYDGKLSLAPGNPNRPLDPAQLKDVTPEVGGKQFFPGMGIPHLIQCMLHMKDFIRNESFELAVQRLFRVVRIALKSNLPYNESDFSKLMVASICNYAKCKAAEKIIKFYNFERADMPNINDQITSTTDNVSDTGLVEFGKYEILNDTTEQLFEKWNKLVPKTDLLCLPIKLKNLIDYFLDTPFVDDAHVNLQIYDVVLREVPLYGLSDDGKQVISAGKWDVRYGSLSQIFDEADAIIKAYGTPYADMAKTGLFTTPHLEVMESKDVLAKQKLRIDKRFFTYLINAYSPRGKSILDSYIMKAPYKRIDLINGNDDELLMATLALARIEDYDIPFYVSEQAVFYSALPGVTLISVNKAGYSPTSVSEFSAENAHKRNVALQTDGYFNTNTTLDYQQSASTLTWVGALDNIFAPGSFSSISAMTISALNTAIIRANFGTPNTTGKRCGLLVLNNSSYATQYAIWWRFKVLTVNPHTFSVELVFGTLADFGVDQISSNPDTGTSIYTFTQTPSNGGVGMDYCYWQIEVPYTNVITIPAAARDNVCEYIYSRANNIYDGADIIWTVSVSITTVAGGVAYSNSNRNLLMRYMDDVEFHLPIVCDHSTTFLINGSNKVTLSDTPQACKTDYLPVIVDDSNVKASLYWGLLGLFDMYVVKPVAKNNRSEGKYKREEDKK